MLWTTCVPKGAWMSMGRVVARAGRVWNKQFPVRPGERVCESCQVAH
jgi:hypothetical protein